LTTDSTQWSLLTATGSVPANIAGASVASINRAFASLQSAANGFTGASYLATSSLVGANVIANLALYYDTGPDTTAVTIPSSIITSSSTYVNIFTPNNTSTQANFSQRHNGIWTATGAYSLVFTNGSVALNILVSYVRVVGLQIESVDTATDTRGSYIDDINLSSLPASVTTSTSDIVFDSNILAYQTATSTSEVIGINDSSGGSTPTVAIVNNIIYGMTGTASNGIDIDGGTSYVYNDTIYDTTLAYNLWGTTVATYKNDIAQDDTTGFDSTTASSTNNISDHGDAPGTNHKDFATVAFVNVSTNDFLLAGYDTTARGNGANLSTDPNYPFTWDIVGDTRPSSGAWDAGANEFIATGTVPTITSFTLPATSTSLTVNVNSFTATSTSASIYAYLITQTSSTPTPSSTGWTTSVPATFTFSSSGTQTAYAWVEDTNGNISSSTSASVIITLPILNVFYSVGQSSSNLMTLSPTVTIASGTATFSQAQTGNIGVGDKVTYNTSAIAYISGKISQTQWSLVTATGTTPANISSSTVASIKRAFTSLNNAVTNMTSASYLNNTSLVGANVIVNLPCYYDTGPDTTAVTIPSSIVTGSSTYLNIFTPNNTSTQANFSERDNGTWTSNAYQLVVTNSGTVLDIRSPYIKVVGLQVETIQTATSTQLYPNAIATSNLSSSVTTSTSRVILDSNLIQGNVASSPNTVSGIYGFQIAGSKPTVIIVNNIIYGFTATGAVNPVGIYIGGTGTASYIYNNTSYGNGIGFQATGSGCTVVYKNNIAQGNGTNGFGGSCFASGSSVDNVSNLADTISLGSNFKTLANVAFVSTSTNDFLLAGYDPTARGKGANLTSDSVNPFTYDIVGTTRPSTGAWDIGANKFIAQSATPPVITSFTIPSASPLSVPILSFAATSTANPVAAYLVSASSNATTLTTSVWNTQVPTSFTPNLVGTTTIYAWVSDVYGNISAAASATIYIYPSSANVSYTVTPTSPGLQIPSTFMGLSFEQGTNTDLFGAPGDPNPIFVQLIKNLSAYGSGPINIRIGGNSTDQTGYPSSSTFAQFAEIAKDTNTRFEIGVNLASGSIPLAISQAQAIVQQMPSSSLNAIEIGNEPDGYSGYSFSQYLTNFTNYAANILPLLPSSVKLMGPSWSSANFLSNLPAFLANESSSLSIVSQHWYSGNGSVGNPLDYLLQDSAVTSGASAVSSSVALTHQDSLPFRMGEVNSLYDGGQNGVSNAFGSALWIVDTLVNFTDVGVDGVNFHGGTGAFYSPFSLKASGTAPSLSFSAVSVNPEYYGMLLFQQATQNGARLIPIATTTASIPHFDAWATVDASGTVRVVLINRNEITQGTVNINLPGSFSSGTLTQLLAPSYQSKNGVTLGGQTFDGTPDGTLQGASSTQTINSSGGIYSVTIPATSAAILTIPSALPSVSMTAPTASSTVSGTITVSATSSAVSPASISSVQFYLDGAPLGSPVTTTSSANTYSYPWNTVLSANASHILYALATDNYSNTATSTSITVTVANQAVLSVPTSTFNFSAAHGSTATSSQTVIVSNAGSAGTTLNWSASSTQTWLTFSPTSGSLAGNATTSVSFIVNPATLALGTYNATATISDPSASSSPQTIPVTLTISDTGVSATMTVPANLATVSSTVPVTATATSTVGISSVQFYLDGSPLGSAVTSSPYTISWNTLTASDGFHTLYSQETDNNSNIASSSEIAITVDNTPPAVSIISPASEATVSGTTSITASSSDAITGVSSVAFYLDGSLLGKSTSNPYSINWDTTQTSNASHGITATATDGAGNATTSQAISVTVYNAPFVSSGGGGGGGGGGSVQSDLAITKTVDQSAPATGATIHYTLTVSDGGPSDSSAVVASDMLPTGVTFDSASSSEGSYASSTGIWTIGTIPNGHQATLVITATVTAATGTIITNTGTVSETPGILNATPQDDTSSATITVAGGGGVTSSSPSSTLSALSGMTVAEMESLLASLETELQALEAQVGNATISSPYIFTTDLQLHDTGPAVNALQSYLIREDKGPAAKVLKIHGATNYFGILTYNALVEFQASVGIHATGYFGPITRAWVNGHE
jgi:hypothetical protein